MTEEEWAKGWEHRHAYNAKWYRRLRRRLPSLLRVYGRLRWWRYSVVSFYAWRTAKWRTEQRRAQP